MQVLVLVTGMQLVLPWFLQTLMIPPPRPGKHQASELTVKAAKIKVAIKTKFMATDGSFFDLIH
jgi:hypothetical protein